MSRNLFSLFYALIWVAIQCVPSSVVAASEDPIPEVRRILMIDSDSGDQLLRLKERTTIDMSAYPETVRLQAIVRPATATSVKFSIRKLSRSGKPGRGREFVSVRGNSRDGTWKLSPGTYEISATPYVKRRRGKSGGVTVIVNNPGVTPTPTQTPNPGETIPTPIATPTPVQPTPTPPATGGTSNLSAVWANDGGDKVSRDELRATNRGASSILNRTWDGDSVNLFGARNEMVAFNLVLESKNASALDVRVSFDKLVGPGGYSITSVPATADKLFNYVGRNIELFFVRYLQIKGLSKLTWGNYDERHVPKRFQRPYTGTGVASGTWNDRPDHDKFYPDIAVPFEAVNNFDINQGENQSIWCDIYIPKDAPAGLYVGYLTILESGKTTRAIPVELKVRNFALPDAPSAKTMLYLGSADLNTRFLGHSYPASQTEQAYSHKLIDRHFQMAHRHKISMIDNNDGYTVWNQDAPRPEWMPRLNGSLFSSANGYDGPGVGTSNNVFSIGTYGAWSWNTQGQSAMWQHSDGWVNWFEQNAPNVEYFLYLIDESPNFAQINTWAQWLNVNPGPGNRLKSFATIPMTNAMASTPELDIAASWARFGVQSQWDAAFSYFKQAGRRAFLYNSYRPATGSFATEDDGVALRQLAWTQVKKNVDRWFAWAANYYNNYQGGTGQTNVFQSAFVFGGKNAAKDPVMGETGWNYTNGDGVMIYPGTDHLFPNDSYGIEGPIASLRLKHWRRGLQDADYISIAKAKDPARVQSIINRMVPKVLWEYGVSNLNDPTYIVSDISWSINPDDWEAARDELADIIDGG